MKRFRLTLAILAILGIAGLSMFSCGGDTENSGNGDTTQMVCKTDMPLNISIYLDLSDRLTREMTPSQMERDTAIINHIVDKFLENVLEQKIIKSKDNFQIFFYPEPNNSSVATIAKNLSVDFNKIKAPEKNKEYKKMKKDVNDGLSVIYNETIQAANWVGCDIWGFFSNKMVDKYCIREGYRNIIIILTDGYFFHKDNKLKEGNAYSYILPQTLEVENSSLIVKRSGLEDLEVMVLEVNPYVSKDLPVLEEKIKTWFTAMGVKPENFVLTGPSMPAHTEHVIDNFLGE